jgi:hypothetical protein
MPYTETEIHGPNFPRPPPDIDNDEERYEIETILNHRKRGRGYQYYVKWKGYDITEASWESTTCFENGSEETLKKYRLRHHLAHLKMAACTFIVLTTPGGQNICLDMMATPQLINTRTDASNNKALQTVCVPTPRPVSNDSGRSRNRLCRTRILTSDPPPTTASIYQEEDLDEVQEK